MPRRSKGLMARWHNMHWMAKTIMTGATTLVAIGAATKVWADWDWPIPATRQYVLDAQYPINQNLQGLLIGQKQARISAIKDILVDMENKKLKASPTEKKRLEIQAQELTIEWNQLEKQIQGLEATKR